MAFFVFDKDLIKLANAPKSCYARLYFIQMKRIHDVKPELTEVNYETAAAFKKKSSN